MGKIIIISCMCLFLFGCTSTMQYNRNLNKSIKYLDKIVDFLDPNKCEDIQYDVIELRDRLEELKNEK